MQDFGEKFAPRYRIDDRFYFANELEFLQDVCAANILKKHAEVLRKEAVNAISKSDFTAKLLQLLGDSHEAKEMTKDDLGLLYADYFMSNLSFDEWFKQFSTGEA